jgi:hypothetical protein
MKMSLVCQLEMTLPGGSPGGVGGDGSADERWGAVAAELAPTSGEDRARARSCSSGNANAQAQRTSGMAAPMGYGRGDLMAGLLAGKYRK